MGTITPSNIVSTALLYESQLILNKVISSKPMKDMERVKKQKNPNGYRQIPNLSMSCILFGRMHTRRCRRRLVNSFKEITKHGSHLCASISLPHFIVVANVLKMCLFQGNRFGLSASSLLFSSISLTMPVHTVDVEFGVIELAHNYFDCGNLARCSIHPLLYDTIHIESV